MYRFRNQKVMFNPKPRLRYPGLHRVKKLIGLSFLFFFGLVPVCVDAAEDNPPLSLSLSEAIQMALANNLDIQIEKENIRLQEATWLSETAPFDPSLRFNAETGRSVRGSTSFAETGLTGADFIEQNDREVSLGWKKPLRWGGEYDITLRQFRTDATFQRTNPTYRGDLALTFTQPLLKGFGTEIKQGPLKIARTQIHIADQTSRARVTEIVLKVISLYWELVFQRENLLAQQTSLKLATQLLESNRARVALGLLAPIEILVAEVAVASREETVLVAQKAIQDTADQLMALIHSRDRPSAFSVILPTDHPVEEEININPNDLVESALRDDPALDALELNIQNKARGVQLAENQTLPSLDFIGAFGPSGIGQTLSAPFEQLFSADFYRWEAGFLFTYPLGNRAAEATLMKARSEQAKAQLEKEKRMREITRTTQEGIRRMKTDFERIRATQRALELAKKQLLAGEERFQLGLISSHDIITFQNDVAIASVNALRALIDYNKSRANLTQWGAAQPPANEPASQGTFPSLGR